MIFVRVFLIIMLAAVPFYAQAQGKGPAIIRDTEIENTIKEWAAPVVQAAGMGKDSINIVIVQSSDLNAFVAGGANVFLYTGLIEKTENPGELIGVFAHELGHIAGGHLIQGQRAMERASYESILGTIVGVGAAIATGDGRAAAAISSGASNIAARRFLAHNRVQESSADQAALTFLEKAQMSAGGLGTFLEKLESEELLPADQQSEYIRTHPLTANRIEAVESRAGTSPYADKSFPAAWLDQHARMRAKLTGFINPGRVPWVYDDSDLSVPARYARSIAAYRNNNVEEALAGIDSLIREEPSNPYFQELKGQMLVDFGRVSEALPYYRKAAGMIPGAPLIDIALAHALIESGGGAQNIEEAIEHLERALVKEPRSSRAHRLLGIAHGKLGEEGKAKLHLAEEAVLQQRFDYARTMAEGALRTFPEGSREAIRAKDILLFLDNNKT